MEQSTTSDNLEVTNPYGSLKLPYGQVSMPVFMPDATLGVVRAVDATDLLDCQVQAVVMNTFHLMQRPGSSTIHALGGLQSSQTRVVSRPTRSSSKTPNLARSMTMALHSNLNQLSASST